MKIFGIVGWKNTGKTGLMERLVAEFTARGLRVSTIKHTHHAVDLDPPGTDSFRHRAAGAAEVALVSQSRVAVMQELRGAPEPLPQDLLARMQPVDLVLVEGFKTAPHPKIETHRGQSALIAADDPTIRAVASDCPVKVTCPVLDLNDTGAIADFIAAEVTL